MTNLNNSYKKAELAILISIPISIIGSTIYLEKKLEKLSTSIHNLSSIEQKIDEGFSDISRKIKHSGVLHIEDKGGSNENPEKFYRINGETCYIEIDAKPIKLYFDRFSYNQE